MSYNWWQLFRNKILGRSYDVDMYINLIDTICSKVYSCRSAEQTKALDFYDYRNVCWECIESPEFQGSIVENEFKTKKDDEIERYLFITCENILQKKILNKNPGLESRIKQMDRVLKPNCTQSCRKWCSCWKLKELRGKTIPYIAGLKDLQKASAGIRRPTIHYPKVDSKKGPAVLDEEMKDFLITVLRRSGGITERNTIISFIQKEFGLVTVQEESFSVRDDDSENESTSEPFPDYILKLLYEREDLLLEPEYLIMAQEIVNVFELKQKEVFYKLFVLEKKQKEIADEMKISNAQVSNIKESIEDVLQDYFQENKTQMFCEEVDAVHNLIKLLIEQEMKKNDK